MTKWTAMPCGGCEMDILVELLYLIGLVYAVICTLALMAYAVKRWK